MYEMSKEKSVFVQGSYKPYNFNGRARVSIKQAKLGDQPAYWSVTVDHKDFGGCCHDFVLALKPSLKPFVDLHMSTVDDGIPMHGFENALHWISGHPRLQSMYSYNPVSSRGSWNTSWEQARSTGATHLRVRLPEFDLIIDRIFTEIEVIPHRFRTEAQLKKSIHDTLQQVFESLKRQWYFETKIADAVFTTMPDTDA